MNFPALVADIRPLASSPQGTVARVVVHPDDRRFKTTDLTPAAYKKAL